MPHTLRITFHGIGPTERDLSEGEASVRLTTASFEASLDAISEVHNHLITFDDGNLSDFDLAVPRLLDRNLTGTFFICSGRLDAPEFLTPHQLRQMLDAGMRIGSHGIDHVQWRTLGRERLRTELADSKARLEDAIGEAVADAACPFGAYDRKVLTEARRSGYRRVFTSDGVGPPIGGWLYPRTTITEEILSADRLPGLASPSFVVRMECATRSLLKSWR